VVSRGLGVDVGARRIHAVALEDGRVEDVLVVAPEEAGALLEHARHASAVAIDAPAAPSTAPHAGDPTISRKFQHGRCAEIGLGRQAGIWVPWVTPVEAPTTGWMTVGFALFRLLTPVTQVVETYPHAAFRRLSPGALPPKLSVAGIRRRVELLEAAGVREPRLLAWGHDALDALVAALVAARVASGDAQPFGCGHDGSVIWLPS
jgi:predicted nuclease with RNAse H fold